MHLLTYNALFKGLAQRHNAIQATATNNRFVRIFLSEDPVQKQVDITEFYDVLRNKLQAKVGQPFFVLQNYQVDYGDNDGDYFNRKVQGAYYVLQKVKVGDHDGRDAAVDACERIAEQILAAAVHALRAEHQVGISVGDAWAEHIGPIAVDHVGVRINLAWTDPATQELTYNPDFFTTA